MTATMSQQLRELSYDAPMSAGTRTKLRVLADEVAGLEHDLKRSMANHVADINPHRYGINTILPSHPALAAGDVLAHQLTFKYQGEILEAWWQARGGHDKCTVCAPEKLEHER